MEVLAGRYHRVECVTDSSGCVAGAVRGTEYVFTAFDVLTGESHELVRIEHRVPFTEWDLAPGGTRVAVVHNDNNEVKIVDLAGGGDQIVIVPGWHGFEFITWTADGAGFVVNATPDEEGMVPRSHAGLIHVDLAGTSTLLRRRPNEWDVRPVLAPDGRHIAFSTMRFHANAWLIENP